MAIRNLFRINSRAPLIERFFSLFLMKLKLEKLDSSVPWRWNGIQSEVFVCRHEGVWKCGVAVAPLLFRALDLRREFLHVMKEKRFFSFSILFLPCSFVANCATEKNSRGSEAIFGTL